MWRRTGCTSRGQRNHFHLDQSGRMNHFHLDQTLEMDEWSYSRHRGSKGTQPCKSSLHDFGSFAHGTVTFKMTRRDFTCTIVKLIGKIGKRATTRIPVSWGSLRTAIRLRNRKRLESWPVFQQWARARVSLPNRRPGWAGGEFNLSHKNEN
jgi:hypothetical protein